MRSETVYKRAYNDALQILAPLGTGTKLPSETVLAGRLGVSRTTVRKLLDVMKRRDLIVGLGRDRIVGQLDGEPKRFPESETVPLSAQVEAQFMQWMLKDDTRPGAIINELELARQFGVATTSIREFLNRFQRFGLIERRAHGGWMFKGFTQKFAMELFEIREMFELRSAHAFTLLKTESSAWQTLRNLRQMHLDLLADVGERYHDFSDLDSRFHRLINSASPNRFIDGFNDVITLIFHYHYQWNKDDELKRNTVAIREHLAYIDALESRDPARVETTCRTHLASARSTLIQATRD